MGYSKRFVSLLAAFVCWAPYARIGHAQSAGSTMALRPGLFAGAALTLTSKDLDARMRLAAETTSRGWFIEAGLPIKGRLGAGIEFGGPSDAVGETRGISFVSKGRQRERLLVGTVRARLTGTARWGVDVIGGAGALFQHHEALEASCVTFTCGDFRRQTSDHVAPTFVTGVDMPVRVGGAVWVGAVFRYHVLARGTHESQIPVRVLPWQYEWKSSNRMSVGFGVRVGR